MWWWRCLLLVG
jgi:hypothetical protein